jgi:hypothetical protein
MVAVVVSYFVFITGRKWFLKFQANRDRSYNTFDKVEFTKQEKENLKKWEFYIAPE